MGPLAAMAAAGLALLAGGSARAAEEGAVCVHDDASSIDVCSGLDVAPTELFAAAVVEPCGAGGNPDTALVVLEATFLADESRQDLGIYLALDGGSAILDSTCYHDRLEPPLEPNPTYGDANGNQIPDLVGDPFYNAEPGDLVDDCGDLAAGTEAIPTLGTLQAPLEVACVDANLNGLVDVDVCVAWSNGPNDHCNNLAGASASTQSRCQCARLDVVGLPEPGAPGAFGCGAVLLAGLGGLAGRRRRVVAIAA